MRRMRCGLERAGKDTRLVDMQLCWGAFLSSCFWSRHPTTSPASEPVPSAVSRRLGSTCRLDGNRSFIMNTTTRPPHAVLIVHNGERYDAHVTHLIEAGLRVSSTHARSAP